LFYCIDCLIYRMKSGAVKESIFDIMQSGPRPITTFLVIKPRALKRHLTKILKKIIQEGFRIIGLELQTMDRQRATILLEHDNTVGLLRELSCQWIVYKTLINLNLYIDLVLC